MTANDTDLLRAQAPRVPHVSRPGSTARRVPRQSERPLSARTALALSVIVPVHNEQHVVEASIRRLLALAAPILADLQVVVVDDGSTDESAHVLQRLAAEDARILLVRHERRMGKGAAFRTAIRHVRGDVTVCHDADLEYHPGDLPALLVPFIEEGADAVFGSRYLAGQYRRALMHRHTVVNKGLTVVSNWLTDLHLTDIETCYKLVRTPLLKSIPLRSNDFRIEVELAFKLAKRRSRIFEAPIRYMPRGYEEGKKIATWDGVLALGAMARYTLVDDVYQEDQYGSQILHVLDKARRFNLWLGDTLRPYVGDCVLEIGAGVGTLTNQLIPRTRYIASDVDGNYLDYLRSYSIGKPYLEVRRIDVTHQEDFDDLDGCCDTALVVNVLEHVSDEHRALRNVHRALEPGGKVIVLVPQWPELYGSLDEALEHRERYTERQLRASLESAGFVVGSVRDFNRFSVPGWWFAGRVLRQRSFSRVQLKAIETLMPLLRVVDGCLPWRGQSLIAVATKPL